MFRNIYNINGEKINILKMNVFLVPKMPSLLSSLCRLVSRQKHLSTGQREQARVAPFARAAHQHQSPGELVNVIHSRVLMFPFF